MLIFYGVGGKVRGKFLIPKGVVPESRKDVVLVKCIQKYVYFVLPLFALPIKCYVFVKRNGKFVKLKESEYSPELAEYIQEQKSYYRPIWWMWIGAVWFPIALLLDLVFNK